MATELEVQRYYEKQNEVVAHYVAQKTPVEIARLTGVPVKEVEKMLMEFKDYALQDRVLREMARETVIQTKLHYQQIIQHMYDALEEATLEGKTRERISAIKAIADIEKQKVDFMQKAGMMANNELSDQLIEYERKQSILVDILGQIAKKYPDVGREIQRKLSEVTGKMTIVTSERDD